MQFKSPLFLQRTKPQFLFPLIIFLAILWILFRPLQEAVEILYSISGGAVKKVSESLSKSKYSFEELLRSKTLLKKQSRTLSILKIKLNYIESEVKKTENLKKILGLQKNIAYKTLAANLVGRTPDNWHKQIIIDKGLANGIKAGDSVLSNKGIVGQIIDVSRNTSIVQLISDPTFRIGCSIGKKGTLGILSGKTNSIGIIHFVPVGSNVKKGDLVITSGISTSNLLQTYPPHHPIGKISKISRRKYKGTDLYIEVTLFENLQTLTNVLVFCPA